MRVKEPRNTQTIYWTQHSKQKMRFYGLSASRLLRILRNPERQEYGVAERTVAIMQSTKSKKPTEVWLMYQKFKKNPKRIKIISAWRYPGKSPAGKPPIPSEVLKILEQDKNL